MTQIAHYRLPDYDPNEVFGCPVELPEAHAEIARLCGERHHDYRDGWEMSWPLKIELVQATNGSWSSLGIWDVERELCPVFSAKKAKEPQ